MHEAVRHSAARFAVSRDFCRILEKTYAGTDWQYLPNMLGGNFEQDFELPEKTIKISPSAASPTCATSKATTCSCLPLPKHSKPIRNLNSKSAAAVQKKAV